MKGWARAYQGAITGRAVAASWVYQAASTPAAPRPVLETAHSLRFARYAPHTRHALVLLACLAAVTGLVGGQSGIALFAGVFLAAFYLPVPGLLAVPSLLLWAPRLDVGAAGGEDVFLRLDQAAVAGLLVYCAFHPRGRLSSPPGNTAFLLFLLAVSASIFAGLLQRTLAAPMSALVYFGQWLEFYGLYVVAWSLGARARPWLAYAWVLPLAALAAYGLAEHFWPYYEVPGVRYRTFERIYFLGQANHAGGLFALAAASGFALAGNPRHRILGLALAVLATLALVPTGSRSGAVAWAAGLGALALVRVPALRWWAPPLGVIALCAVPGGWWGRIAAPGSSMYDRLIAWKSAISTVEAYPLLGLGAGARHRSYYDNHYLMTLAESGVIGMALLIVLLLALARALAHPKPGADTWMCAGALAGLAALAVHALATATFVVTLTAGPLFWYCGLALAAQEDTP